LLGDELARRIIGGRQLGDYRMALLDRGGVIVHTCPEWPEPPKP
jgi:hypothetical protein